MAGDTGLLCYGIGWQKDVDWSFFIYIARRGGDNEVLQWIGLATVGVGGRLLGSWQAHLKLAKEKRRL